MLSKEQVFEKLRAIIMDQLGVEEDEVTLEAHIIDDLGGDSLDVIELEMALEEEFDVYLDADHTGTLTTVDQFVDFIMENRG